jgi:thiamine biosynthesis lipoprotein
LRTDTFCLPRAHPALAGVLALILAACGTEPPAPVEFSGAAMGTTWNVKLAIPPGGGAPPDLQAAVSARIEDLEQSMSTYREDSELSEFNRYAGGDWFPVSPALCEVVAAALEIGAASGGAFDVTVGPLVDLWGFGPAGSRDAPPGEDEIERAIDRTGADQLRADCDRPALRKNRPELQVDLSAIAKGYAVDEVSELLDDYGFTDYLVEIGGELRARGSHPAGRDWSIGIEMPDPEGRTVRSVLALVDRAVATSGDYRNFFEFEGRRYSHTIDPRTGEPVTHDVAAVTVVAASAMTADAWATALLVLGPGEAERIAEDRGLAVLLQDRNQSDARLAGGFEELVRQSAP